MLLFSVAEERRLRYSELDRQIQNAAEEIQRLESIRLDLQTKQEENYQ